MTDFSVRWTVVTLVTDFSVGMTVMPDFNVRLTVVTLITDFSVRMTIVSDFTVRLEDLIYTKYTQLINEIMNE